MTTLTLNSNTQTAPAQQALANPNLPMRFRLSMFTFGLLSQLGPNHALFLPLSILAIFSGVVNYSWQREIALRGEEIDRDVFLHSGGNPRLIKRANPGLNN